MDDAKNFPTMIIPDGTEIGVDEQGQLSIRTPGNLVIQNSARYSVISSGNGSVRIDPGVTVEAVSVDAADTCFVAGEITAWKVRARKIILEKNARANIMLQECEGLELDRAARLVGNFTSEKELYLMLGRFSRQLKEMPGLLASSDQTPPPRFKNTERVGFFDDGPFVSPDGEDEPGPESGRQADETLGLVRAILERELGRPSLETTGRKALEKALDLVRTHRVAELQSTYAELLSKVPNPSEDLLQAQTMIAGLPPLSS